MSRTKTNEQIESLVTSTNEEQVPVVVTNPINDIVTSSAPKSQRIRELLAKGFTRSQVAVMLGIRYQHVRNVQITPIKKG